MDSDDNEKTQFIKKSNKTQGKQQVKVQKQSKNKKDQNSDKSQESQEKTLQIRQSKKQTELQQQNTESEIINRQQNNRTQNKLVSATNDQVSQGRVKKSSFEIISEQHRNRGTQTQNIPSVYVPTQILSLFANESEISSNFFMKPHSLFTLLIFLGFVFYYSVFQTEAPENPDAYLKNSWMGMTFLYFSIIVFAIIFFPETYMQRPHPVFWKITVGFGLSWFAAIVFANFLSREQLFKFLREFVDPKLGDKSIEKSYAEDCRIYIPDHPISPWFNILDKIDVFITAHFVGWFFKMVIVRDFKLCQIQSVMFEILEITFRHWLPNFWECWWDHIFLDLIICNTGGMIIGYYFLKYFKVQPLQWSLKTKQNNSWFKNFKQLFIVPQLEEHEWQVFSSCWNFIAVTWFMIVFNFIDLSYFFNQFILWIEPNHKICAIRTFIMGFLSIPASREYYQFTINKDLGKVGPAVWTLHAVLGAQMMLFLKNYQFMKDEFKEPFPWYVITFWGFIGTFFICTIIRLLFQDIKRWISNKNRRLLKIKRREQRGDDRSITSSSQDEF